MFAHISGYEYEYEYKSLHKSYILHCTIHAWSMVWAGRSQLRKQRKRMVVHCMRMRKRLRIGRACLSSESEYT